MTVETSVPWIFGQIQSWYVTTMTSKLSRSTIGVHRDCLGLPTEDVLFLFHHAHTYIFIMYVIRNLFGFSLGLTLWEISLVRIYHRLIMCTIRCTLFILTWNHECLPCTPCWVVYNGLQHPIYWRRKHTNFINWMGFKILRFYFLKSQVWSHWMCYY